MLEAYSVSRAAARLGVSERRVRALIQARRLPAQRLGRSLAIDPADLRAFARERREVGRPLSAANAWALLAFLEGVRPDWVDPAVASRLRRRLRDGAWVERALVRSEPRSRIYAWRFLPGDLQKLADEYDLALSGLSARDPGIDVIPSQRDGVDAYVVRQALDQIERRFQPEKSSVEPNVLLRVPVKPWILEQPVAPSSVVAADLLDHGEPRVERAARRLLQKAVDDFDS